MTILNYIKDKSLSIFILFITVIISYSFMLAVNIESHSAIFIEMIFIICFVLILIFDFIKKRKYYNELLKSFQDIEEKSYITEVIKKPNFIEGKILYDILKAEGKYINDINQMYNNKFTEYRRYIETWVHEVKTPIATSKLLIENNKNITTLSIEEEITKIDDYVEQVLYVSKSDTVEKDYHIKKVYMQDIVMDVVRRKSKEIINEGIKLTLHDLDFYILSDEKWIEFIIGQIISNSIKYKGDKPTIEIYTEKLDNKINLYIKDNGIGIPQQDISKVFEKGFTGSNGRKKHSASTGIGLYLCKKLCDKLEVSIEVLPDNIEGTTIKLTFLEAR
ncbi:sensor histidine kinase [Romboutsia ilealis]|uniref:histidine kinase n=1 Tax=Romboutsia faecis TaxID=2764597 RepID=A0ABR7JK57_9FIRM|nr:sensor histidine kinase [Romboutsia faecis]MBC5995305.1 sensor histidine kinase [Romboutsia faecis]MRN24450.1 sensor histidine kinase [Romboutsia ilealis]